MGEWEEELSTDNPMLLYSHICVVYMCLNAYEKLLKTSGSLLLSSSYNLCTQLCMCASCLLANSQGDQL